MSATLAPTAAPANCLKVWADANYIYAELPGKTGGVPCILSFRRDAAGFAKAVNLIYKHSDVSGKPQTCVEPKRKLSGTATQHAQAQALLRRRGLLK